MNKLFEINELAELKAYLLTKDIELFREQLFALFLQYADYKNADDWNKAVRICECMAITGWGNHEPVEAVKGIFFNGNPQTAFRNRMGDYRFVDAIWSQRKDGLTMEQGRTSYHHSPDVKDKPTLLWDYPVTEDILDVKLAKQRNWIAKNPVLITRGISNCYESSKPVIESIENDLQKELDTKMQSEKYGIAINRIVFHCSYSYFDNDHCKTNYIIADEKQKLKKSDFYPELLKMYSKEVIEKNGYFLRNRYDYGSFNADNGTIKVIIHFEKELGDKSIAGQKAFILEHINTALKAVVEKLKKKKLDYDFESMLSDFEIIADNWKKS